MNIIHIFVGPKKELVFPLISIVNTLTEHKLDLNND